MLIPGISTIHDGIMECSVRITSSAHVCKAYISNAIARRVREFEDAQMSTSSAEPRDSMIAAAGKPLHFAGETRDIAATQGQLW